MSLFFDLAIQQREREAKQAARKAAGRALVNCRRDRRGYTLLTRAETERARRAARKEARAVDQWIREQIARDLEIRSTQERISFALLLMPLTAFDGELPATRKKRQADLIALANTTELNRKEFFARYLTAREMAAFRRFRTNFDRDD